MTPSGLRNDGILEASWRVLAESAKGRYLTVVLPRKHKMARAERLTTTVSTKGQVILPKAVRDERRWEAGTRLTVENTDEGVLLKAAPLFAPTEIGAVFGSLRFAGKPQTIEEMDAAVAAEARRRARD
jgi:AbrB family looped-hinge helix DNA binding protein